MTLGLDPVLDAPESAPEPARRLLPRTWAAIVGVPLLVALWALAVWLPMPYVTYAPGVTVDVLGKRDGQEIIQVSGRKAYHDDGELRMVTVFVTRPDARVNLFEAMQAWVSPSRALYPFDAIYRPDETAEEADQESTLAMSTSQDAATAAALTELGYDLPEKVKVVEVTEGMPADGSLKVGDVITTANGEKVRTPEDLGNAIQRTTTGESVTLGIERDGKPLTIDITPTDVDGTPRIGITQGVGFDFPFQVSVGIDPNIGGPSAGLMFSLAIYDTLTPGSMTDGATIAGTGTIDPSGTVGPIGGIQQKIVAARDAGAELFMVPPDNCDEAYEAAQEGLNGDMTLVKARTMHSAVRSIESWAADPDATLPACTQADAESAGE